MPLCQLNYLAIKIKDLSKEYETAFESYAQKWNEFITFVSEILHGEASLNCLEQQFRAKS
jgi:vacuolar-type H+-ATPase subunit I/STV1